MKINNLTLKKFRCFEYLNIGFNGSNCLLYGPNAIGKTSILEAVYCLGVIKSYRCNDQKELIKAGEEHFYIEGNFFDDEKKAKISLFTNQQARRLILNHNIVNKNIEYLGTINVVVFSATDFLVFKMGVSERRKMFEVIICEISKKYYQTINNYKKLLKSRNTLLKSLILENKQELYGVLFAVDEQIVDCGLQITDMRNRFVNKLNEYVNEVHNSISNGKESLIIKYSPSVLTNDRQQYLNLLKNNLENDLKRGYTTIGPHSDDYIFLINNQDVSKYGSQGQQRNAILSTKLAMANLLGDTTGNNPIVLLDDVFSELDKDRSNSLIKHLNFNYQHIITSASLSDLDEEMLKEKNIKLINVEELLTFKGVDNSL